MKNQLFAVIIAVAVSGCTDLAQQSDSSNAGGKTRAQVMQELKQAQEDGSATTCGFATGSCPDINLRKGQK
ncbi:MAG: DUF4148 domain-containing protein [Formivibrio sp.]|nr:DUF4148 domain-containing protein [Formivibrio sp.]